eukprot:COSAG01_NODE_3642_length_5836_cov_6.885132_2_plen_72_part_00
MRPWQATYGEEHFADNPGVKKWTTKLLAKVAHWEKWDKRKKKQASGGIHGARGDTKKKKKPKKKKRRRLGG